MSFENDINHLLFRTLLLIQQASSCLSGCHLSIWLHFHSLKHLKAKTLKPPLMCTLSMQRVFSHIKKKSRTIIQLSCGGDDDLKQLSSKYSNCSNLTVASLSSYQGVTVGERVFTFTHTAVMWPSFSINYSHWKMHRIKPYANRRSLCAFHFHYVVVSRLT